jgi:hypothetical protein
MRRRSPARVLLLVPLLLGTPSLALAGPPLICHPFQTGGGNLLIWGTGPGWNTPDPAYDERRLADDLVPLLSSDAPVLTRMENMRRAAIYASRNATVAEALIDTLLARTARAGDDAAGVAAVFDAGYFVETYKQAVSVHRRLFVRTDGYELVRRALARSGGNADMEFAAALMTRGAVAEQHLRRARAGASPLLAANIASQGR